MNWTNLPDISTWLEQIGSYYVNPIKIASYVLIIMLSIFVLFLLQSKTKVMMLIGFSLLMSGLLVLRHFMKHQDMSASYNKDAILSIQNFYATLGITAVTVALVLPWITPMKTREIYSTRNSKLLKFLNYNSRGQRTVHSESAEEENIVGVDTFRNTRASKIMAQWSTTLLKKWSL